MMFFVASVKESSIRFTLNLVKVVKLALVPECSTFLLIKSFSRIIIIAAYSLKGSGFD